MTAVVKPEVSTPLPSADFGEVLGQCAECHERNWRLFRDREGAPVAHCRKCGHERDVFKSEAVRLFALLLPPGP